MKRTIGTLATLATAIVLACAALAATAAEVSSPISGEPPRAAVATSLEPGRNGQAPVTPRVETKELQRQFADPPMERRMRAWWFLLTPYVVPEGVAKDIAAMERAGMGGAITVLGFGPCVGVPKGWDNHQRMIYNSEAYYKLSRQIIDDMARRGMSYTVHNTEGYKGAAGFWVKLENGMRVIRLEHLHVTGPKRLNQPWPDMPSGKEQWGSDVQAYRKQLPSVLGVNTPPIPPGERSTFRDIALLAVPGHIKPLKDIQIQGDLLLDRNFVKGSELLGREGVVPEERIIDLSDKLADDGTLAWDVPEGQWTLLRFMSEPTGFSSNGIEVDKWDREQFMDTIEKQIGKLAEQNKDHAGRALAGIWQDSWESCVQTWSDNMAQVFEERRGYDPVKYLPVLAGVAVNDKEQSERFVWDLRRTIADQFTYVGWASFLQEWANARGLEFGLESPIHFINQTEWWSVPGIPMDESWFNMPWEKSLQTDKTMVAAVADYHGKPVVAMEGFTNTVGAFREHPGNMKPLGDSFLCAGWNRIAPHCYSSQPFDEKPGYRIYGIQANRSNTWWEKARPLFMHIGRAQTLMQQLDGAADILVVQHETPINEWLTKRFFKSIKSTLSKKGFLYDACDVYQLKNLTVEDGEIVNPRGKRYQTMFFLAPEVSIAGCQGRIRPEILAELDRLATAGARIHSNSPQPEGTPSLHGFPESDQKAARLGEKLWGGGKIGKPADLAKNLTPDLENLGDLNWTHRRSDKLDAYFLANHKAQSVHQDLIFRIAGKQPQLWHPESGQVKDIAVWREQDGRTVIPLDFDAYESYFVVFTEPADAPAVPRWTGIDGPAPAQVSEEAGVWKLLAPQAGEWTLTAPDGAVKSVKVDGFPAPVAVEGPWTLTYPTGQDTPETLTLPKLMNMIDHENPMVRGFSGTVTYRTSFNIPKGTLAPDLRFELDLGDVQQLAEVKLNGKDLGIAYRNPYVLEAGDALQEGENQLEIEITNTWLNRMVAQMNLPDEKKIGDPSSWLNDRLLKEKGYDDIRDQGCLEDSGLIGPVVIKTKRVVTITADAK